MSSERDDLLETRSTLVSQIRETETRGEKVFHIYIYIYTLYMYICIDIYVYEYIYIYIYI